MRTLVVHPYDPSTDFLCGIYREHDCDVLRDGNRVDPGLLIQYNRIIMLGHGSQWGLFTTCGYPASVYTIDASHQVSLMGKDNVYIWCHASMFVAANGLTGFASGMFISEVNEASYYGIQATQKEIDYSNHLFASVLGKHLNSEELTKNVLAEYRDDHNPVIHYNSTLLLRLTKG